MNPATLPTKPRALTPPVNGAPAALATTPLHPEAVHEIRGISVKNDES